ncbi:MAG: phosphomannomutase/phosphoglucomutase [Clostridiales bacterium]|nr:phosphomannomutase/phosphoglucomutase [Clostridiales bacterium]
METRLSVLKSGTDIRGSADTQLTDDIVGKIAVGFTEFLSKGLKCEYSELTIAVGHDTRLSSPRIADTFINSLSALGVNVKDCALASTPAMFFTTVDLGCSGAVEITASHMPPDKNGLKFFLRSGSLSGKDIEKILSIAENAQTPEGSNAALVESINYMNTYCEHLRTFICDEVNADDFSRPLRGFKIAVDAGNGVGGFFAEKILSPLGADTSGSRFLEPDGSFPNHVPNPEDKKAMASIVDAVVSSDADLGIIFDTDVDRAACVDKGGKPLDRNRLIALAAAIVSENVNEPTIVTDSVTSDGLSDFINNTLGAHHRRFKRGYKNVIDEAMRITTEGGNAPLAIETSGHAAFLKNHYLDDGAYLATRIIIKMAQLKKDGRTLSELIKDLREPLEEREVRLPCFEADYRLCGERLCANFEQFAEDTDGLSAVPDNCEGVRVNFDEQRGNGWLLLRMSVHDPVAVINIESNSEGGILKIAEVFGTFLQTQSGF